MKKVSASQNRFGICVHFALVLSLLVGCTDDVGTPAPIPNVVRLETSMGAGTGIYLGDGIVLTNWHVAVSSAIVDIQTDWQMNRADYLAQYNASSDSAPAYVIGPNPNASYCVNFDANYNALDYMVTEDPLTEDFEAVFATDIYLDCIPVVATSEMRCDFTEVPPRFNAHNVPISALLYANMDLDLGIVKIAVNPDVAPQLLRLELGVVAPTPGQRVRIGGYPRGVRSAVFEACQVISTEVETLADPDPLMPSILTVPSFKIDCKTVRHGSSGSAVIDDKTGKVIGLIWTGEFDEYDNTTIVYATAVSGWQQLVDRAENQENHSQLDRLLTEFGAN